MITQRPPEQEQKGNSLEINLCCREPGWFKSWFCFSCLKWRPDQKQGRPQSPQTEVQTKVGLPLLSSHRTVEYAKPCISTARQNLNGLNHPAP